MAIQTTEKISVRNLISTGKIQRAIVEFVRQRDHVSFVELKNLLGVYAAGENSITSTIDPNIVFWTSISDALSRDLAQLAREKRIFFHPCNPLVYIADGAMLNLPVVKRPPAGGYGRLHWLPVAMRIVP